MQKKTSGNMSEDYVQQQYNIGLDIISHKRANRL